MLRTHLRTHYLWSPLSLLPLVSRQGPHVTLDAIWQCHTARRRHSTYPPMRRLAANERHAMEGVLPWFVRARREHVCGDAGSALGALARDGRSLHPRRARVLVPRPPSPRTLMGEKKRSHARAQWPPSYLAKGRGNSEDHMVLFVSPLCRLLWVGLVQTRPWL